MLSAPAFTAPVDFDVTGTLNGAPVNGELRVDEQTGQVLSWRIRVDAGPSDSGGETLSAFTFSDQRGDASLSGNGGMHLRRFEKNPYAPAGGNDNRDFRTSMSVEELLVVPPTGRQVDITDCWNCNPFRTGSAVFTPRAGGSESAVTGSTQQTSMSQEPNGDQDIAPRIDSAVFCTGPGGLSFDIAVAGTSSADFAFRIAADGEAFTAPTERFEVNFDVNGVSTRGVTPTVATAGTPRFDRWRDGPVSPFTLTPLGNHSYRLRGRIEPGSQPFAAGDNIAQIGLRSFGSRTRTAVLASVIIGACAATAAQQP